MVFGGSDKVAKDFITAVDNTLELIYNNPTGWRNEYKFYFELSLKRFPHTIIYSIDKEEKLINILAVFHQKRNPIKKISKIINRYKKQSLKVRGKENLNEN